MTPAPTPPPAGTVDFSAREKAQGICLQWGVGFMVEALMVALNEAFAAGEAAERKRAAEVARRHVPSSPSADCEREMRRVGQDIAAAIERGAAGEATLTGGGE